MKIWLRIDPLSRHYRSYLEPRQAVTIAEPSNFQTLKKTPPKAKILLTSLNKTCISSKKCNESHCKSSEKSHCNLQWLSKIQNRVNLWLDWNSSAEVYSLVEHVWVSTWPATRWWTLFFSSNKGPALTLKPFKLCRVFLGALFSMFYLSNQAVLVPIWTEIVLNLEFRKSRSPIY